MGEKRTRMAIACHFFSDFDTAHSSEPSIHSSYPLLIHLPAARHFPVSYSAYVGGRGGLGFPISPRPPTIARYTM